MPERPFVKQILRFKSCKKLLLMVRSDQGYRFVFMTFCVFWVAVRFVLTIIEVQILLFKSSLIEVSPSLICIVLFVSK